MPVFSCGGMRYQHSWKDDPEEKMPEDGQKNIEATIQRSLELGINHIETARGYGTSERQLGHILPGLPRDEMIVQTKGGPKEDPKKFLEDFETSMAKLKLDHVDLFAMHGVNNAEVLAQVLRPGGCLEVARKLQKVGRFRFLGFSTHGPADTICKAIESGEFDYVNLHWFYIYQFNWRAVEAAKRQDMGVFVISPSDKGGMLYKPTEKLVELCQPLHPMVFNDLFCLSRPEVHTLSIGASKPTDFDEHMKTLPLIEKADEILPPIIERLEQALADKLGKEWAETWSQGLPRHEDTPEGINVHTTLWLRNLALAYDMIEYGKFRYNLLGNGGHWFPGALTDKADELDFTECLKDSPHAEKIPSLLKETHELLHAEEKKRLSESE